MDEPFEALDEIVRDHLNEQLNQLWDRTSKTVIFVRTRFLRRSSCRPRSSSCRQWPDTA